MVVIYARTVNPCSADNTPATPADNLPSHGVPAGQLLPKQKSSWLHASIRASHASASIQATCMQARDEQPKYSAATLAFDTPSRRRGLDRITEAGMRASAVELARELGKQLQMCVVAILLPRVR